MGKAMANKISSCYAGTSCALLEPLRRRCRLRIILLVMISRTIVTALAATHISAAIKVKSTGILGPEGARRCAALDGVSVVSPLDVSGGMLF